MSDFVMLGGERYLRLELVARWYQVEVTFLEEAIELELLDVEASEAGQVLLPEHALDALAEILRWKWQTGLELGALAVVMAGRVRQRP